MIMSERPHRSSNQKISATANERYQQRNIADTYNDLKTIRSNTDYEGTVTRKTAYSSSDKDQVVDFKINLAKTKRQEEIINSNRKRKQRLIATCTASHNYKY